MFSYNMRNKSKRGLLVKKSYVWPYSVHYDISMELRKHFQLSFLLKWDELLFVIAGGVYVQRHRDDPPDLGEVRVPTVGPSDWMVHGYVIHGTDSWLCHLHVLHQQRGHQTGKLMQRPNPQSKWKQKGSPTTEN